MTRHYGQPITVTVTVPRAEGSVGPPAAFRWRGVRYRVREVLATWHLRDRWWEATPPPDAPPNAPPTPPTAATAGASDRHYYRLRCTVSTVSMASAERSASGGGRGGRGGRGGGGSDLLCDIYYDAARAGWVLDRVHD